MLLFFVAVEPQEAKIGAGKIKVLAKRKKIAWGNMKKKEGNWDWRKGFLPFSFFPPYFPARYTFASSPVSESITGYQENTPLLLYNQAVNS